MVLSLTFSIETPINPITGRPHYFVKHNDTTVDVDGFPEIVIPERLRSVLNGKGNHLFPYIRIFADENRFDAYAEELRNHFPKWVNVKRELAEATSNLIWSEGDHLLFRELLDWCCTYPYLFRINWGY